MSAAEHLFKVNPNCEKLNEEMVGDFHTHTHTQQKDLFCANMVDQIFKH